MAPPSLYCCKSSEPKQIGIGLNVSFERTLGFSPKVYFLYVPKVYFLEVYFPNVVYRTKLSEAVVSI